MLKSQFFNRSTTKYYSSKVRQSKYPMVPKWMYYTCAWLKIVEGVCSNLSSIIYAIESSILYILNVLNIFTFRYCPEFCDPHASYTRVSCVKSIQIVLACFRESLLIYKLAYGTFRYFQQKLSHQKKGITSVRQSGELTKHIEYFGLFSVDIAKYF